MAFKAISDAVEIIWHAGGARLVYITSHTAARELIERNISWKRSSVDTVSVFDPDFFKIYGDGLLLLQEEGDDRIARDTLFHLRTGNYTEAAKHPDSEAPVPPLSTDLSGLMERRAELAGPLTPFVKAAIEENMAEDDVHENVAVTANILAVSAKFVFTEQSSPFSQHIWNDENAIPLKAIARLFELAYRRNYSPEHPEWNILPHIMANCADNEKRRNVIIEKMKETCQRLPDGISNGAFPLMLEGTHGHHYYRMAVAPAAIVASLAFVHAADYRPELYVGSRILAEARRDFDWARVVPNFLIERHFDTYYDERGNIKRGSRLVIAADSINTAAAHEDWNMLIPDGLAASALEYCAEHGETGRVKNLLNFENKSRHLRKELMEATGKALVLTLTKHHPETTDVILEQSRAMVSAAAAKAIPQAMALVPRTTVGARIAENLDPHHHHGLAKKSAAFVNVILKHGESCKLYEDAVAAAIVKTLPAIFSEAAASDIFKNIMRKAKGKESWVDAVVQAMPALHAEAVGLNRHGWETQNLNHKLDKAVKGFPVFEQALAEVRKPAMVRTAERSSGFFADSKRWLGRLVRRPGASASATPGPSPHCS